MKGVSFFTGETGSTIHRLKEVRDRLQIYKWTYLTDPLLLLEHLEVLHGCDTLRRLYISPVDYSEAETNAIASVIVSCKNLEEFQLGHRIGVRMSPSLIGALVFNKSVKYVCAKAYLMDNVCTELICSRSDWKELYLTIGSAVHVDRMLSKSQSIKTLVLDMYDNDGKMDFHNLSLRTIRINGTPRYDIQERNARILQNVIDSVVQILLIGKYAWRFWVPYDIVRQIAQYVWSTRFDPDVWLK